MFLKEIYAIREGVFSKEFCEKIIKTGQASEKKQAKIKDGVQANRKSHISWIADKKVYDEILPIIKEININSGWTFNLKEFEPLQFTTYNEGDFYNWHIDQHIEPYNNGLIRKLSFSILLNNDYEGGGLEFCTPHPIEKKHSFIKLEKKYEPGTIIAFPSFIHHKVQIVEHNTRYSLVGWCNGHPFK